MKQFVKSLGILVLCIVMMSSCNNSIKKGKSNQLAVVKENVGQEKATKNDSQLEVIISSDKDTYVLGDAIMLSFEVKNEGTKMISFLPWQTPLEGRFTADRFAVLLNDSPIAYSGMMVKRKAATDEDYLKLEAGKSTKAEINLLDAYKLVEKGVYKIQFKGTYESLPESNCIQIEVK